MSKTIRIQGINFIIRKLNPDDFYKHYLELLNQLSNFNIETMKFEDFLHFVNQLDERNQIYVVENTDLKTLVATITILIENKIIHNMGKVCHIEDVVVDESMRGFGLGKIIVDYAVNYAIEIGCYKTILDCSNHNIVFYEKCGFKNKGAQMALYH